MWICVSETQCLWCNCAWICCRFWCSNQCSGLLMDDGPPQGCRYIDAAVTRFTEISFDNDPKGEIWMVQSSAVICFSIRTRLLCSWRFGSSITGSLRWCVSQVRRSKAYKTTCMRLMQHDISPTAWCMVLFSHSVTDNSISVDGMPSSENWEFAYSFRRVHNADSFSTCSMQWLGFSVFTALTASACLLCSLSLLSCSVSLTVLDISQTWKHFHSIVNNGLYPCEIFGRKFVCVSSTLNNTRHSSV